MKESTSKSNAGGMWPFKQSNSDRAQLLAPPPILFIGCWALGQLMEWTIPLYCIRSPYNSLLGAPIFSLGFAILIYAASQLVRAKTDLITISPSTKLVQAGLFKYSRNPIYLGGPMMYLGCAIFAKTTWPICLLPFPILLVNECAIKKEEEYLLRKFGDEYRRYKAKVPRWII